MPPKRTLSESKQLTGIVEPPPPLPLPGRESEFVTITNYVVDRAEGQRADVLFISGACGCGKTSTVARAEAWLKALPSTLKAFKDCPSPCDSDLAEGGSHSGLLDADSRTQSRPSAPINLKWTYINCSGLTRDGAMDAIWEAVSCDASFADRLLRHIREMYQVMCGTSDRARAASSITSLASAKNTPAAKADSTDLFFKKYNPLATKGDRVSQKILCKPLKGKILPFFVFVLDEAEFSDSSSYPLFAAFASAAQEFSNRMALILVSNARSLSFLPLNIAGRRAVTELVFEGYSVEKLKQACRAYFAEKFRREGKLVEEPEDTKSSSRKGLKKSRPQVLDDVLAPSALDYAVKTAVSLHSADLRKAVALCGNAISASEAKADKNRVTMDPSSVSTGAGKSLPEKPTPLGTKRARDEEPAPKTTPCTAKGPVSQKVTLQGMLSTISDINSALDQIRTFPPYTRQLLKCFVECVKRTNGATYSFMPATLQAELWKKADELRIPKPSAASVIEALEDLRGMGFVASSAASTRSQKLYTLAWSLAELEPKMAVLPGFL